MKLSLQALGIVVSAVAALTVLTWAVPAFGGPQAVSSASPLKIAKKALKRANQANRTAKRALARTDDQDFLRGGLSTTKSSTLVVQPGVVTSHSVQCPGGTEVVSGGWTLISGAANVFWDRQSGNGWSVGVSNFDATVTTAELTVEAQCAENPRGITATSAKADARRDSADLRAQRAAMNRDR